MFKSFWCRSLLGSTGIFLCFSLLIKPSHAEPLLKLPITITFEDAPNLPKIPTPYVPNCVSADFFATTYGVSFTQSFYDPICDSFVWSPQIASGFDGLYAYVAEHAGEFSMSLNSNILPPVGQVSFSVTAVSYNLDTRTEEFVPVTVAGSAASNTLQVGPGKATATILATPGQAFQWVYAAALTPSSGRYVGATVVIDDIVLSDPINTLDLAAGFLNLSQNSTPIGSGGNVVAGTTVVITVPISGKNFGTPETRSTIVKLQAGSQILSQTISLEDIQSAGTLMVPFNVTFRSEDVGIQTITAIIDPGNALSERNFANNTSSVQVRVESPLTISNVQISQAVNNFILPGQTDVTLVQGKSAVVLATVTAPSGTSLDPSTPITVSATLPDGSSATASVKLSDAIANDGKHNVAVIGPFVPTASGTISVTASGSSPLTAASPVPTEVVVKKTNGLGVAYIGLNYIPAPVNLLCGNGLRESPPNAHATNSTQFIQDTFPVADGAVTNITVPVSGLLLSPPLPSYYIPDLLEVATVKALRGARNGVGVVPSDPSGGTGSGYFFCHLDSNTRGVTMHAYANPDDSLPLSLLKQALSPNASLVEEGFWVVTAHEIAHTFGTPDLQNPVSIGDKQAFDVGRNIQIDHSSFVTDFMGNGLFPYFQNLNHAWISGDTFGTIFQGLLANPVDPQVILLSGTILQNGTLQLNSSFILPNGTSTPFDPGIPNVINALDADGNILSQSSFLSGSDLELRTDKGQTLPVTDTPFVVQVPMGPNVNSIQIIADGKVLKTLSPNSQVLIDAINEIPDTSFRKNSTKSRSDLLRWARNIEDTLKFCKKHRGRGDERDETHPCSDRILRQLFELRERIDKMLNASSVKTSPLQLTKLDIFETIDAVILNLTPQSVQIKSETGPVTISPYPQMDFDDRKLFKIVQVTQGSFGSVEIIFNGAAIRYMPTANFGHAARTDSFTYTLSSPEGNQTTIGVTLTPCTEGK